MVWQLFEAEKTLESWKIFWESGKIDLKKWWLQGIIMGTCFS